MFNPKGVIKELRSLLVNDGICSNKYMNRMDSFFPFKDGGSCERVYKKIMGDDFVRVNEKKANSFVSYNRRAISDQKNGLFVDLYENSV